MRTITLSNGVTCEVRDKADLQVRHRRELETSIMLAGSALGKLPNTIEELKTLDLNKAALTAREIDSIFHLQDATILASVAGWSAETPFPKTYEELEDLPTEVYDELAEATQNLDSVADLRPDFDPSNPKSDEFTSSPITPSSDSEAHLREEQAPPSTSSQPTVGTSIGSD